MDEEFEHAQCFDKKVILAKCADAMGTLKLEGSANAQLRRQDHHTVLTYPFAPCFCLLLLYQLAGIIASLYKLRRTSTRII